MSQHSHVTAPTEFVEVGGIRFGYRRFGSGPGTPLVFLQHFRGGLDNWDPLVTDGLAIGRQVILFDNAGVAGSSGETPDRIESMGDHAADFIRALGLPSVDVLGFSIGGYVAQALTLRHPDLVHRLVLVGTAPRGAETEGRHPDVPTVAGNPVPVLEDFLFLFFGPTVEARQAGTEFWARRHERTVDVDPPSSVQAAQAQSAAVLDWRTPHGERFADLHSINQPTLVVNGNRDVMVPTINSYLLSQHIPNAQLVLYPVAGHGALFQYPNVFVRQVDQFLSDERPFA